jgi:hypothetical protein
VPLKDRNALNFFSVLIVMENIIVIALCLIIGVVCLSDIIDLSEFVTSKTKQIIGIIALLIAYYFYNGEKLF